MTHIVLVAVFALLKRSALQGTSVWQPPNHNEWISEKYETRTLVMRDEFRRFFEQRWSKLKLELWREEKKNWQPLALNPLPCHTILSDWEVLLKKRETRCETEKESVRGKNKTASVNWRLSLRTLEDTNVQWLKKKVRSTSMNVRT